MYWARHMQYVGSLKFFAVAVGCSILGAISQCPARAGWGTLSETLKPSFLVSLSWRHIFSLISVQCLWHFWPSGTAEIKQFMKPFVHSHQGEQHVWRAPGLMSVTSYSLAVVLMVPLRVVSSWYHFTYSMCKAISSSTALIFFSTWGWFPSLSSTGKQALEHPVSDRCRDSEPLFPLSHPLLSLSTFLSPFLYSAFLWICTWGGFCLSRLPPPSTLPIPLSPSPSFSPPSSLPSSPFSVQHAYGFSIEGVCPSLAPTPLLPLSILLPPPLSLSPFSFPPSPPFLCSPFPWICIDSVSARAHFLGNKINMQKAVSPKRAREGLPGIY